MKCEFCKADIQTQIRSGYQYKESGLDNVYLDNIKIAVCENCKTEEVIISKLSTVLDSIGQALALQPYPLIGDEIRFLRKQVCLKSREMATFLRVDAATYSRWENSERSIGAQSDSLIRYLYFTLKATEKEERMPDRLAEKIAAVNSALSYRLEIHVNLDNPSVYSYQRENREVRKIVQAVPITNVQEIKAGRVVKDTVTVFGLSISEWAVVDYEGGGDPPFITEFDSDFLSAATS